MTDKHVENLSTVSYSQNAPDETQLAINSTLNESMTIYIQTSAVESVTNSSNASVLIDGEQVSSGITEQGNSSWVAFEIDHFSERTVTIQATGTGGGGFLGGLNDTAVFVAMALIFVGVVAYLYSRETEDQYMG